LSFALAPRRRICTNADIWALAQPQIFCVWATCHPANRASARVLEKSGLAFEARLARWEQRPNIGEDAGDNLVFSVTRQHDFRSERVSNPSRSQKPSNEKAKEEKRPVNEPQA
jgi:hypothetical protein